MERNKVIHLHGKSVLTPEKAQKFQLEEGEIAVRNAEKSGESQLYVVSHDSEGAQTVDTFITKEAIERYIKSKLFVGTQTEYEDAWKAQEISVGAVVIILDESELAEPELDGGASSAILGKGVLGQLVLGKS